MQIFHAVTDDKGIYLCQYGPCVKKMVRIIKICFISVLVCDCLLQQVFLGLPLTQIPCAFILSAFGIKEKNEGDNDYVRL